MKKLASFASFFFFFTPKITLVFTILYHRNQVATIEDIQIHLLFGIKKIEIGIAIMNQCLS